WVIEPTSSAVRYLGYPLYSNQSQLLHFLDDIKAKIKTHSIILRERHLTVRGSSLVANSLLLSRLWHILRVVPIPATWLLEIKRTIRAFV
ncbi:hypothetical protein BD770DRAFT_306025, partial [Pilaira anomala]